MQYYNKRHHAHVKVLGWNERTQKGTFAGSFTDIRTGQRVASRFIRAGADLIFPIAGAAGIGAASAVRSADASGKHVALEWPDTDGCFSVPRYCPYLLTSVTKGIADEVKHVVLAAAAAGWLRLTSAPWPTAAWLSLRTTISPGGFPPRCGPSSPVSKRRSRGERSSRPPVARSDGVLRPKKWKVRPPH